MAGYTWLFCGTVMSIKRRDIFTIILICVLGWADGAGLHRGRAQGK